MLCCGLLTLVAAAALAIWRWRRGAPRMLLVIGGVGLVAAPVLAFSAAGQAARMNQTEAIALAMMSLCGPAKTMKLGKP